MHEKSPVINVKKRERLGTRYCDRIRKAGGLPAIVYGHGEQPVPVYVPEARDTVRKITAGEKVFRMSLEGGFSEQVVLIKELQFDYLGTNIVHADFARVDLNERVRAKVPVHLIGEAVGLKQVGAILMHPTSEVEVECRVADLPDFVEVRIDELDVGHAITVAEIKLPGTDMKMLTDKHWMVAQIVIQQEIKVGEETAAVAGPAEPEVITAKKPAEGEEGAAAAPGAKGAAPAAGAKGAAPAAGAKGAAPAAGAKPAAGGEKKK
ncbi:50S ribosomal protein L25 [Phycisphaerales bacterium]|nr:50S ribosomal protein L25 [Phycisphaerales bacterium]